MSASIRSLVILLLAIAPAVAGTPAGRVMTSELRIDSGAIRGLVVGDKQDIQVFKGIPYAAPPTGERRWKPPQPPSPWPGVRDCFEFGAACPQTMPVLLSHIPEAVINAPLSEDCLFLNVWTPVHRGSEKLPVLYWIHGGGFVMGAASQPMYDCEGLARLGCVVVSINYRLGLLGFLAHPALSRESPQNVSGNYGLLDQIEGLRWVHRNIAEFGGDPNRVTIFGESAGGISVLCLMVSPQAKGFFHGAIAQSATAMNLPRLRAMGTSQDTAEQIGRRFISGCGLNDSPDPAEMRRLEIKDLLKSGPSDLPLGTALQLKPLSLTLGPTVDGQVIPDQPNLLFAAGRQHAVPMIVGNTRDEMSLFLIGKLMPFDRAAYLNRLKDDFGDLGEQLAEAYPVKDAEMIRSTVTQLATDLSFVSETRLIARAHSASGQKTFRYQFSRGSPRGFLQFLGAHHGAEVAYLFQGPLIRDEASLKISNTLGRYWVNFAATGDPDGQGLPTWPAYRRDTEEMVEFAEDVKVLKRYRNDQLNVIEKVLQAMAPRAQGR